MEKESREITSPKPQPDIEAPIADPYAPVTTPPASDSPSGLPLGEVCSDHQPNHPHPTSHNDKTICQQIWRLTSVICSWVIVVPVLLIATILTFLIEVLNFLLLGIHSHLVYVLIKGCKILPEKYRSSLLGKPIDNEVKSLKHLADVIETRGTVVRTLLRIRLMIWSLLLLLIALTVPALKHFRLLRLPLWQWALVFPSVLLGNRILKWAASFVVEVIYFLYGKNPTLEYWAQGLKKSVAHIVFFLVLLVIWIHYFQSRPDLTDQVSKLIVEYGTWALVSLVIGAVLWLVKSILVLSWTAKAIYHHFKGRIIKVGRQLYFMVLISEPWLDIYKAKESSDNNEDQETKAGNTQNKKRNEKFIKLTKLMKDARNIFMKNSDNIEEVIQDNSLHDVKVMARFFMFLSEVSPREDDHLLAERVYKLYEDLFSNNKSIQLEDLKRKLEAKYEEKYKKKEEEIEKLSGVKAEMEREKIEAKKREIKDIISDVEALHKDLKQEPEKVDAEPFKKYMNNAYKNSLALGRTLSNAKEVMKYMDMIMSVFLVILVILCWLLLSDLATTRALVALASPFVAATFIFGDTCKRIFEGVIFSFVTHPFDVGDLCVIDNTELEVKRIGILETTFLKIVGKEEVLYPTSVLATKSIINFKGDPDINDKVELCLDSAVNSNVIDTLKGEIDNFLKTNDKYEESCEVEIKEVGSNITIAVYFKHRWGSGDVFHAQCVQKKNSQRAQLFRIIKKHLEDKNYYPSNSLKQSSSSPS